MASLKQRALNVAIAIDQLAWTLVTLGVGSPDETISAALWRMEAQGKLAGRLFRPLVDALLWFDPHHCEMSYWSEKTRSQLPATYRD